MSLDYSAIFYTDNKKKPPVQRKYEEVYRTMSVYLQSKAPEHLFKARRPLESKDNKTLEHRKENHRNFLKDAFDLTLLKAIETAQGIDYTEKVEDAEFVKYYKEYKVVKNSITLSLDEYITNNVFKYSENDPNSYLVVLPKHPDGEILIPQGVVTDELIQFPNFNNVQNKNITTELVLVPYYDVRYVDNERFIYKAGEWYLTEEDNEQEADYFIEVSKDETLIWYPVWGANSISYNSVVYYYNGLSENPFIPTKNNFLLHDEGEDDQYMYNVSHLYAATLLADLIYGQHSDLLITAIRHVYPIKTQVKTSCPNIEAVYEKDGLHWHGNALCQTCNGKGYTLNETPYGTILIDANKGTENEKNFTGSAVTFASPDTAPMTFNKEYINELKADLYNLLGITNQNNTNASAESKQMDMQQRISRLTIIVKDILRVKESVIRVMENFFTTNPATYTISYDSGFDVHNDEDIAQELKFAKEANYPIELRRNILRKLYLKVNGKTAENEFIVDYLINNDMLYGYDNSELQNQVAIFGSLIGAREIMLHNRGEVILKKVIAEQDKTAPLDYNKIDARFNELLDSYVR
jgi:hypothetical protein